MLKQQVMDSKTSILCLNETWLKSGFDNDLVNIQGFSLYRLDRAWSQDGKTIKRGGGLAMYINSDLSHSSTDLAHLNISSENIELQCLTVSIPKTRKIVLLNTYRPPQGDLSEFKYSIKDTIAKVKVKDNTEIFLVGDMNINVGDGQTAQAKELGVLLKSLGLEQLIKKATRVSSKSNSVIDLIFTNSDYIEDAGCIDLNISDHLATFVTRKKHFEKSARVDFEGRSYKNYSTEVYQGDLLREDWTGFYNNDNPNSAWEIFYGKMVTTLDTYCPIRKFKVKETRYPWVTGEVLELIKDKDRALSRAKRTNKPDDWENAKRQRNDVGLMLQNMRRDYIEQEQRLNRDNPQKFWRNLKSVVPGKKKCQGKINLRKAGKLIEENEAADALNYFFANLGGDLQEDQAVPWFTAGANSPELIDHCQANFFQLLKIVKEINTNKSSGLEKLSSRVLKDALLVLIPQLLYLVNLSLQTGIFPDAWKIATVIPLFKGGSKSEMGNYRPISLLPVPGKILEKIVHANLAGHLEDCNLLTEYQGGFRKGHSTVSSINALSDDIFMGMNSKRVTVAVFVDLAKAFNTVNHNILLVKLVKLGVTGALLSWCRNYLKGRTQRTLANNKLSGLDAVPCGVPQGSILGPLFFLVYINDMVFSLKSAKVQLYADDTVLYVTDNHGHTAARKLQRDLDIFSHWCKANKLSLNAKKTKHMNFGTRNQTKKCTIIQLAIDGKAIQRVPSFKYLGVILDPTISFRAHIEHVSNTVSHKMFMLSKVRRYLNNESMLCIYRSMVLPYLDYADVAFSGASSNLLEKLQKLQEKCLKICLNIHGKCDRNVLHNRASVNKLADRRATHVNCYMYQRLTKGIRRREDQEGVMRTRARSAPSFVVDKPNVESYKRSISYFGAVQWNSLPPATRNINSFFSFKSKQKCELSRIRY